MDTSDIWEEAKNGVFEWKSGKLMFRETVPTLLEISSFKFALEIWNDCVSRTIPDITFRDNYDIPNFAYHPQKNYLDEAKEIAMNLKPPKCIEKMIVNDLCTIDRKIQGWVNYFSSGMNTTLPNNYRINRVDPKWLVWRSSGKVDLKNTVSSILSTAELDEVQKFVIMCKFCLLDKIIHISLSSLPSDFIKSITFEENHLVFYWICYLRNELDKIPRPDFTSINVLMAGKCQDNIFAFEYFWNHSNTDDQITEAIAKLNAAGSNGYIFIKAFFPKMTRYQQHRLFCEKLPLIVINMWICLRMPNCAIAIWMHVKDECPSEQFVELVRSMLYTKIITSEEDMHLFLKFWNAASDHLKQQVTQLPVVKSLMEAFRCHQNYSLSSLKFLYEFLSLADAHIRQSTLKEMLNKLPTQFAHSLVLLDVIKMCFPVAGEREQFLHSVLNWNGTQKHGLCLINDEKFDRLFLMLKIFSPTINTNRKFVKKLLEFEEEWVEIIVDKGEKLKLIEIHIKKWKFVLNYNKWMELSKFVDKACSSDDDPLWIPNIKKKFVSSFAAAKGFFWHIQGHFDELTKVLDEVLTPEEAELFRKTLLNEFENNIVTTNEYKNSFEERSFVEFASWCLGDVEKMEELKGSLPQDKILDECFASVCYTFSCYNFSEFFNPLNKWLKFFCNDDEAKKYKIRKIYEWNDERALNELFYPKYSGCEKNLKLLLQHIFENDVEEMEKWRLSKQTAVRKRKHSDDDCDPTAYDPDNDAHPDPYSEHYDDWPDFESVVDDDDDDDDYYYNDDDDDERYEAYNNSYVTEDDDENFLSF